MPAEGLRNNGESPTHYRMDDARPALGAAALPADGDPARPRTVARPHVEPAGAQRRELPLPFSGGPGGAAPRVEYYPRCEGAQGHGPGGEGFAFVIQSENGFDAAGCAGAGVGYGVGARRAALACNRSISRSVAIQFDTHARLRIDAYRQDADPDDTRTRLKWDRWNAMGIFTDGRNRQEDEHTVYMIDPSYENFQIDDGEVHHVAITYTHRRRQEHRPPDKYGVGGIRGTGLGVLEVTLDHGIARSEGTVLQKACRTRRTGSRRSRSTSTSPSTASTSSARGSASPPVQATSPPSTTTSAPSPSASASAARRTGEGAHCLV